MNETTGNNWRRNVALLLEHFSFVILFCSMHYNVDMHFFVMRRDSPILIFLWDLVIITSGFVLGGP